MTTQQLSFNSPSSTTPKAAPLGLAAAPAHKADLIITRDSVTGSKKNKEALGEHGLFLAQQFLAWRRPSRTQLQNNWVDTVLVPMLEGLGQVVARDEYGNVFTSSASSYKGGAQHTTLFTAHVDTVHSPTSEEAGQSVAFDASKRVLFTPDGTCLGADDGTGCYILYKMIEADVPGDYAFYLDEERGRLGSQHDLAKNFSKGPTHYNRCISFDRKAATSVITKQRGDRCCSDEFANALSKALGNGFKPDPTGSFTDSATFTDLIPECTNVSVGYRDQHTSRETQDLNELDTIIEALIKVDWEALPTQRDPAAKPAPPPAFTAPKKKKKKKKKKRIEQRGFSEILEALMDTDHEREEVQSFLTTHPNLAAYILVEHHNITFDDFEEVLYALDHDLYFASIQREMEDDSIDLYDTIWG